MQQVPKLSIPRKFCRSLVPVCGKCASKRHRIETCSSAAVKCYHCGEAYYVRHRDCERQAKERSILTIQTREILTRREAIQYLSKTNPDRHRSYARAARSAESKTTTEEGARSPTNGGQPSSEDTSRAATRAKEN